MIENTFNREYRSMNRLFRTTCRGLVPDPLLRFPVFLLFLVFTLSSCGGGGGNSSSAVLLPPSASTDNVTSITMTTAVLRGSVVPNGSTVTTWFEYGTLANLSVYDNTAPPQIVGGTENIAITHTLTNLTPGQTYYYRLAAQEGDVTVKGNISNFTTNNPPPSVVTDNATGVVVNGATLVARVNPNGAVTTAWFEYGISPTLSSFTTSESRDLSAGSDNVTVEIPVTGLAGYQTYYFRAVASSVEGTVTGNILSFSTELPPPAATTGAAGNITTSGAILNGTVNPNGFPTETWFEYGTDNALSTYVETGRVGRGSGTTNIDISTNLSGISAYTTYYYRLAAGSTADPDVYTKGIIKSFKTGDYYVAIGDSITLGSHDTITTDGTGYEPVLDELLTADKNYPHVVLNAGVSGTYSSSGLSAVTAILNDSNYDSAKYFLILYGTNDALTPVSKSVFKSNIQSIITAVKNDGRIPYLAKVPYTTDSARSDTAIQEYNQAIDELRSENGISVAAPDFYTWFKNHPTELADGIHPNGTGYQSMAAKWFEVLP